MANLKCDNYKATNQYYNQLLLWENAYNWKKRSVSHKYHQIPH